MFANKELYGTNFIQYFLSVRFYILDVRFFFIKTIFTTITRNKSLLRLTIIVFNSSYASHIFFSKNIKIVKFLYISFINVVNSY